MLVGHNVININFVYKLNVCIVLKVEVDDLTVQKTTLIWTVRSD